MIASKNASWRVSEGNKPITRELSMGKINIQGLRALVKEVSTGLEEDWVVKALIAARLQRDFECNGSREASKAANNNHWKATRFISAY
jgi:hypothetical protein